MLYLSGPFNFLSYGIVVRNILENLYNISKNIAFFPIGQMDGFSQTLQSVIANQTRLALSTSDISLRIFHQFDLANRIGKGLHFGFPIFELDRFTELEKAHICSCDGIIVASQWAKSIVEQYTKNPIIVAPLGVDRRIFHEKKIVNNKKQTIFLNIGKWEVRKCHDIIPAIFDSAFTKEDNVALWMVPQNIFLSQNEQQTFYDYYAKSKLFDKIKFFNRVSNEELCLMMNRCTCGLSINTCEGWNLPGLELMSCGKPLIISNHTAQTEFCQTQSNYLIRHTEMEDAYDGKFFLNNGHINTGRWWKFGREQFEQCVEYMREVHRCNMDDDIILQQDNIEQAKKFSWDNCAKKILLGINGEVSANKYSDSRYDI